MASRNTLIRIDQDVIGQLAGIAVDTAKPHAHRGEYDPRNLKNVLRWVNGRRAPKGLSLISLPSENASVALKCIDDDLNVSFRIPKGKRAK